MDLKQYFRQVRETEAALPEEYAFIVSSSKDGGKAGVISEVPRVVAAKMLVEARATLATPEQISLFREQQEAAKKTAEQAQLAKQIHVAILSDRDTHQNVSIRKGNGPSTTGK